MTSGGHIRAGTERSRLGRNRAARRPLGEAGFELGELRAGHQRGAHRPGPPGSVPWASTIGAHCGSECSASTAPQPSDNEPSSAEETPTTIAVDEPQTPP